MFKVQNPDFKARIEKYLDRQNFMKHIGFGLTVLEPGITEGTLEVTDTHKQQKGLLHGGVVASVADIVAGFAAYTLVPPDYNVVTGEIKISYLRAGLGQTLIARGKVIKPGLKISFCEAEVVEIRESSEVLLAKATTTMVILEPGKVFAGTSGV